MDHVIPGEARRRDQPVLLAETTPVKYNIAKGSYYPRYVGLSRAGGARGIWDGWHRPMMDFIEANSDLIAGWHYIAADWSADPTWRWVPLFANCDGRPWATPQLLVIWNRHVNSGPFLQASANLFRAPRGGR